MNSFVHIDFSVSFCPGWCFLVVSFIKMVVSFRVFKKASPNNKVTIYLGRRDFIDHVTESDPIDGVLLIDKEYLQGRQVILVPKGQLISE